MNTDINMNEYIINIDGYQRNGEDRETLSLFTLGSFQKNDDHYLISYNDSEATGFAGDVTTLEVVGDRLVTVTRRGNTFSELIIENGRRHTCHYDTGFGTMMLGVRADEIKNRLGENGGSLRFRYHLDVNSNEVSENMLNITVRENTGRA